MKTPDHNLLNRIREARRKIEELEQFTLRIFNFLERVAVRLLLFGLLVYHAYAIVHNLAER